MLDHLAAENTITFDLENINKVMPAMVLQSVVF